MAAGGQRSDIAKYGYVEFKSKHLKSYRKRWLVLYSSSLHKPARLVKYTNEKEFQQDANGRHEYFFTDVISAERIPTKEKGVRIRLSSDGCKEISFICDSDVGANDWVACIQKEVAGDRETFEATVVHSAHANLQGTVALRIADGNVTIVQEGFALLSIPLTTIRKYQMDADSVFWIETGRSSPVGEGFLHFRSNFAYCILSRLDDQARQETKRRGSNASSTPSNYEDNPSPAAHPTNASYIPGVSMSPNPNPNPMERTKERFEFPPESRGVHSPAPNQYSEYPRIPTAHSLPRLDQNANWGQDRGYGLQDRGYQQARRGIVRTNTALVARDPSSLSRETTTQPPYMRMANPVFGEAQHAMSEEGTPYTLMKTADRDSDRRDYLTPLHVRPDARFRDDNRYS